MWPPSTRDRGLSRHQSCHCCPPVTNKILPRELPNLWTFIPAEDRYVSPLTLNLILGVHNQSRKSLKKTHKIGGEMTWSPPFKGFFISNRIKHSQEQILFFLSRQNLTLLAFQWRIYNGISERVHLSWEETHFLWGCALGG